MHDFTKKNIQKYNDTILNCTINNAKQKYLLRNIDYRLLKIYN